MAYQLGGYKAKVKPVQVAFDGDTFEARYKPGALTPEFEDTLRSGENNSSSVVYMLAAVVDSADVELEPGVPLAFDEATLTRQPSLFLKAISEAILEDLNPGEASGASSFAG